MQEQLKLEDLTLEQAQQVITQQSNQLETIAGRLEVTVRQREAAFNEAAALEVLVRQLQNQIKQLTAKSEEGVQ